MQEKQQIAQIVLYKEKHLQVLIFHFTLCLVSAESLTQLTNFFANFFLLLRFLHGALHQKTNIFVLH